MLAGSGRPRKACNQCKNQKVRCSGEKPRCKRCDRLKRTCTYVGGLASPYLQSQSTENAPPAISYPSHEHDKDDSLLENPGFPDARFLPFAQDQPVHRSPTQQHYLGIPPPLLSSLVSVFYSHIYNASLLLRRSTFLEGLAKGTVRPHVVLSVCAFAAVFYRDNKGQTSLVDNGFCTEWAEQAGKLVYQEVEVPHEDNIVTFMILALFWYTRGEWQRCYVHKGNATLIVQLLGLGKERPRDDSPLESEVLRRRFWANYLMNCHTADSPLVGEPSQFTLELSLPWKEEDFEMGTSTAPRATLLSGLGGGSLYAEMVHALTLWHEVSSLVKMPEQHASEKMSAIYEMDGKVLKQWSKLPRQFSLTPANISNIPTALLPKLLLIHTVYRQCLTAIHASIIPLFSWSTDDGAPPAARRLSACVAYEQACEASTLFGAVLRNYSELSAIPSFVAYAAYSGCAVQIPFMWCTEPAVRDRAYTNVKTNATMIHVLAQYWKFAALLEVHLRHIYKMHSRNPIHLENEPKYLDSDQLRGIRLHGRRARDSILGHTAILWTKTGIPPRQGDEGTELDTEEEAISQAPAEDRHATQADAPGQLAARTGSDVVLGTSQAIPAGSEAEPASVAVALDDSHHQNRHLAPYGQVNDTSSMQPDFYDQQLSQFDFFHPFLDPEMLDLFPGGEAINFTQVDPSPASLNFLDGWAPEMDGIMELQSRSAGVRDYGM